MATALQIPRRRVSAVFLWVMRDSVRKSKREPYNIVERDYGNRRSTRIEPAGLALKPESALNVNEDVYDDVQFFDRPPWAYRHGTFA